MSDHFRISRAFPAMAKAVSLAGKSLPLLCAAIIVSGGACIGVSAKAPGATVPGAVSAVKRCRAVRPADDGALDDLEDSNNQITKSGGRDGYWWSAADPKGSKIEMQPSEPGAAASEMAMRITGVTVPGKPEDGAW